MSIDPLLNPSCSNCLATADLYRCNCKHLLLCLKCGKKWVEDGRFCSICGIRVSCLIKEYAVRACYKSKKNDFIGANDGVQDPQVKDPHTARIPVVTYYLLTTEGKEFVSILSSPRCKEPGENEEAQEGNEAEAEAEETARMSRLIEKGDDQEHAEMFTNHDEAVGNQLELAREVDSYLKVRNKVVAYKIRERLKLMGWTVVDLQNAKFKYIHPNGTSYYSLIKACQDMHGITVSQEDTYKSEVLSLLIQKQILLPGTEVCYREKEKNMKMAGIVTRDGIKCHCCQIVYNLYGFECHARKLHYQPAANIYLQNGKSLVDCQIELMCKCMPKDDTTNNSRDDLCSICLSLSGKRLFGCPKCQTSYHFECLNLKDVPCSNWICPSCHCAICHKSESDDMLSCDQCQTLIHASCSDPACRTEAKWFCGSYCAQTFEGLQKFRRKIIPRGHDSFTWSVIKPMTWGNEDGNIMAENYCQLKLAMDVLHECFDPYKELSTRIQLVEDVLFGGRSNLQRYYTIVLEKNDELVSVAILRVLRNKIAEVPLVGTRFNFRRDGLCRILMDELEKLVLELGVERVIISCVPSALNTWTGSFGFTEMTLSERSVCLPPYLQGTVMCHKLLKEPADSIKSIRSQDRNSLDKNDKADNFRKVGRNSEVLKVRSTPPASAKSVTQSCPKKRKTHVDDSMVLHGDKACQQLVSTEDIRHVRKKAPCIQSEMFIQPTFTGLSSKLDSLDCQLYDPRQTPVDGSTAQSETGVAPVAGDDNCVLEELRLNYESSDID